MELQTKSNIVFCGLQGSGKTTIGKRVANLLSLPFFDIDHLIEKQDGKNRSCREICKEEGEPFFRGLEQEALFSLKTLETPSVISLGGGSLDLQEAQSYIPKLGLLIYIKAPFATIWKRMLLRGLPSYLPRQNPKKTFSRIAQKRILSFENLAHITVESHGRLEEETAWEVIRLAKCSSLLLGANPTEKRLESSLMDALQAFSLREKKSMKL